MKIYTIKLDRGGKFLLSEFTKFFSVFGIINQLTSIAPPKYNNIVERAYNMHIRSYWKEPTICTSKLKYHSSYGPRQ